jgi:hypothetical protein
MSAVTTAIALQRLHAFPPVEHGRNGYEPLAMVLDIAALRLLTGCFIIFHLLLRFAGKAARFFATTDHCTTASILWEHCKKTAKESAQVTAWEFPPSRLAAHYRIEPARRWSIAGRPSR